MANIQSAEKRNRQRIKRRVRNLHHLNTTRTMVKKAVAAIDSKESRMQDVVMSAVRQLDKAAQKGVIKKKTASRRISRLVQNLNQVSAN